MKMFFTVEGGPGPASLGLWAGISRVKNCSHQSENSDVGCAVLSVIWKFQALVEANPKVLMG